MAEGNAKPTGPLARLMEWLDERMPLTETIEYHATKYYAPKNFNFWYYFGILATVVLGLQLVTGIWLTMSYVPSGDGAFASVEYIMRDVEYGWLIRYLHSTGASAFFVVVYLHMFRALAYGSYRKPRELLWLIGMGIYLVLMAEGFFGYLLPWGNMSYWGAQVIVSLFGAIPIVGADLMEWVRGDFLMSEITLNRFFALHVVALPLALVGLVFVHIVALHHVGSNNPDGIEIKANKDADGKPVDGIPFHPYYTVHDFRATVVFLFLFCAVVFFAPEMAGYFIEKPNFEQANPLKTPELIAPVWYYTPFYSMLRAATFPFLGLAAKFWGLVVMGAAILLPAVLPWLDRSPVRSMRYKGLASKLFLAVFVISFFVLGYLGTIHPTPIATAVAQVCTVIYFAYFVLMPWYTRVEKTKTPPERVT
ncbi:MAG: cytochrome bc complex cytochrome b subunit [Gammaproteobacteria bacterium]|nr:cytochrome bc complex cytochrome b subunit [Gammaproteobacteria bacterium]